MDALSFVVPRILLFAVTHGSGVFIVPCRNPQGLLQVAGDLWRWRGSCCHLAGRLQEGHHMKTAFFITALGTANFHHGKVFLQFLQFCTEYWGTVALFLPERASTMAAILSVLCRLLQRTCVDFLQFKSMCRLTSS